MSADIEAQVYELLDQAAALAEGASRAQIARVWRVSRQLVSRMAGEQVDHSPLEI